MIRSLGNTIIRMSEIRTSITENLEKLSLTSQGEKTDINDGQVIVKKGSGKTKIRKGQNEEDYQTQKLDFQQKGPVINTETWLEEINLDNIDPNSKSDRAKLEYLAGRYYFKRDYTKCLQTTEKALELFKDLNRKKIVNEIKELEYLQQKCTEKIDATSTD